MRLDTGWAAFSFGPKGFWELHERIAEPTERCLAAWIEKRPEVWMARDEMGSFVLTWVFEDKLCNDLPCVEHKRAGSFWWDGNGKH